MRLDEWNKFWEPFSCYHYSCTNDKEMRMDQWLAVFGDSEEGNSIADETVRHQGPSSCDPNICRMASGFCVDCTKCSLHCTCNGEPQRLSVVTAPPACDPNTCKQLICGDCSRCMKHCLCDQGDEIMTPRPSSTGSHQGKMEDADFSESHSMPSVLLANSQIP